MFLYCTFCVIALLSISCLSFVSLFIRDYVAAPTYLSCHIKHHKSTQTLRSSETQLLTIPFTRTELAKRAFRCSTPSVWNSLPSLITNSDSLTTFKSQLKTYFFHLAFDCSIHVCLTSSYSRQRP